MLFNIRMINFIYLTIYVNIHHTLDRPVIITLTPNDNFEKIIELVENNVRSNND
jgi:hypothetical protein